METPWSAANGPRGRQALPVQEKDEDATMSQTGDAHKGEEFSFHDNPDLIVIRSQSAVAAYRNPDGDVVIRQESWPDDDTWIIIKPENVPALIAALADLVGQLPAARTNGAHQPARQVRTSAHRRAHLEAALSAHPTKSNRQIALQVGVSESAVRKIIDEIVNARTPAGGWTADTLAEWGLPWPPAKGWKRALVAKLLLQPA
jgi:hypothetical protein